MVLPESLTRRAFFPLTVVDYGMNVALSCLAAARKEEFNVKETEGKRMYWTSEVANPTVLSSPVKRSASACHRPQR